MTRALLLLLLLWPLSAAPRSHAEKMRFARLHPCPSTGLPIPKCKGFVIDHVNPICNGGPDKAENMQWMDTKSAKEKDKWERAICRK